MDGNQNCINTLDLRSNARHLFLNSCSCIAIIDKLIVNMINILSNYQNNINTTEYRNLADSLRGRKARVLAMP